MLGRIALRIATIGALMGRTMVGDNVLDSEIGSLEVSADNSVRTDQEKPFISVYVEGSKIEGGLDGRSLHKAGEVDLLIETGIAAAMTETDQATGESRIVGLGIPSTDAAMELFLDALGREIIAALTDPRDAWAELWRSLSTRIVKIDRRRTSDANTGARIAAHQMVITVDALPDPVYGEPINDTSVWRKLLDRMEADEHPYLETVRRLLGDPTGILDNEHQRRRFGLTLDEARALFDIAVQSAEATEPDVQSVTSEKV